MAYGHSLPDIAECEILFLYSTIFKEQTTIFFMILKNIDHLIKTTHNELISSTAVL